MSCPSCRPPDPSLRAEGGYVADLVSTVSRSCNGACQAPKGGRAGKGRHDN